MTRVSEQVHERLRREILDGRLAVGEPVPSERVLAEELAVSRHAVREALKRLQQAGLVAISQGGATRVLDWRDSGGLEVLLDLAGVGGSAYAGPAPAEIIRSALEMRLSIGVDAARRCALRGAVGVREGVRALAAQTAGQVGVDDAAVDEDYIALWRAVVAGSQNVAYRLALNSLVTAVAAHDGLVEATRPRDADAIRELGAAIAAGDGERAAVAADALLEPDTHLF